MDFSADLHFIGMGSPGAPCWESNTYRNRCYYRVAIEHIGPEGETALWSTSSYVITTDSATGHSTTRHVSATGLDLGPVTSIRFSAWGLYGDGVGSRDNPIEDVNAVLDPEAVADYEAAVEAAAADLGYALAPGAPIGVLNAVSRLNQTQIDNLLLGNPACPNTNPSSLNDCQLMYAKLLAAGITTTGAIVAVIQAFPDAAEGVLPPPPEPPGDDDDTGLPPPVIEPPDGTSTEPMTGSYVQPAWIDSAAGLELRQTLKAELESLGLDPVRIIDTTCGRLLRSSTQLTVEEWHACIALRALARQNGVTADDVISMWMTGYPDSTSGTASTAAAAGQAMRTALNAVLSTIDLPDPAMNGGAGAHLLDDGFDASEIADGLTPFEDYAEAQDVDPAPPGAFEETNESMSARAAAYERQITGTQDGVSYIVHRDGSNAVKFDGYRNGVLIEVKGPNLAKFVEAGTGTFYDWFRGADSFKDQARRQVTAAQGTPVRWVFAEDRAATAVRALLDDEGLTTVETVVVPEAD